jgi:t-SNARE complex subunit (syntaxin)
MHCGNKFPEDECVLLRQIRDSVEESQREILNIRNLIRRTQKKPRLGKNLVYAIIVIIIIITVVTVLFFQSNRAFF